MANFSLLVQDLFSYIVDDIGFHLYEIKDDLVIWKKEKYFIRVCYDKRYSHEIDFGIYVENSIEPQFDINEILEIAGMPPRTQAFQASDETRLFRVLETISLLFFDVCKHVDLFSSESMELLKKIRDKNCNNYTMENRITQFKNTEETIWKEKKYDALVELYEKNKDILTALQKKRLEYAKRKMLTDTV